MICRITEKTFGRTMHGLSLENDVLRTTILLDKGADIYELTYKPANLDVLWKSPWGMREPTRSIDSASNSVATWLENYAGGWQEIFPSGGGPATYKGIELNFHGEASLIPWEVEIVELSSGAAEVRLFTRLFRSPFSIERRMRVEAGSPVLSTKGKITNQGGENMDYMWSHHPAFGAPFLSQHCRVDIGAKRLRSDDGYVGNNNPMKVDTPYTWPVAEGTDMSIVPGQNTPRDILAYFTFDDPWYGITNTELGLGVGMVWDKAAFPYAWYWQEMNSSPGFPWYKGAYVMAIEPASSIPGQGIVNVMEKTQTHRTLAPGESAESSLSAVFYEASKGITGITANGTVHLK
jgi:galactose mutarotase-like enzyme